MAAFPVAFLGQASNVFVTPSGTATGNCPAGTASAPNLTPSGFNTSSNWGTGTGKIGAGTTVLICGTFSQPASSGTLLTFQAGGSSGNPVILTFDTNTNITAPSWTASAISGNGQSYITVDGGTNGIIQATLNGTSGQACPGGTCAHQDDNGGCFSDQYSSNGNITVKNLACANLYVRSCPSGQEASCGDTNGQNTTCFSLQEGSNLTYQHNICHDARNGEVIGTSSTNNYSNHTIASNTIYHTCDAIIWAGNQSTGQTMTNLNVSGNVISDGYLWAITGNSCHGDGMHIWQNNRAPVSGMVISDNFIYGNWGDSINAFIFVEGCANSCSGGSTDWVSPMIFNNILEDDTTVSHSGNGMISISYDDSGHIVNNTINGNTQVNLYVSTNETVQNNIFLNGFLTQLHTSSGTTLTSWDYNTYYQMNGWDGNAGTFSGWKTDCSCDSHSTSGTNPSLTASVTSLPVSSPAAANYEPTSGSATITKQGQDLTSLSIGSLDSDFAGVSRPSGTCSSQGSSSCWDIGAYAFNSGGGVAPPTNLAATAY